MSQPILHYTNGRGRAEGIRMMLAAAGVQFTEAPFITKFEQLEQLRKNGDLLFQQFPLLEIDGKKLVQSGAILRYIARKYGLFGKNNDETTQIDILTEGTRDFLGFFLSFGWGDDASTLDDIRKKAFPRYMPVFEKGYKDTGGHDGACCHWCETIPYPMQPLRTVVILAESKSGYLVGDSLSMADVCLLEVLLNIPERAPEGFDGYPKLKEYMNRISSLPNIAAFLKGPQRKKPNDAQYVKEVKEALGWN